MVTRREVLLAAGAFGAAALLPLRAAFAATDQLHIGLDHEPPHLDPSIGADSATLAISFDNLFEGLTRLDEAGAVQPGLATAWTLAADGLSCDFTLQRGVRYHDGTSFDAAHVVFSLKRLLAGPGSERPRFAALADVVAVDEFTVRVTLKQADAALLESLALPAAVMVAPESADNNRAVPIGTGPFAFVQWDNGEQIVLARNEDYWGTHPRINEASFSFFADAGAAAAALAAGEIDGVPAFSAPEVAAGLKDNAALRVVTGKGPDGAPRIGAWNAELAGMWADAPLGAVPLAGIYWKLADGGAPPAPTRPAPSLDEGDDGDEIDGDAGAV